MSLEAFKKMTKGINNGKDVDPALMDEIYGIIEVDPISLKEDDDARLKQETA